MGYLVDLTRGLWRENPTFRMVVGLCPTLAVTNAVANGIAMGLATTFVLIGSCVIISALRKITPDKIRMPIFVISIATFTTIVSMLMNAYFLSLYNVLKLYISLIVVNCIIMARAEGFASKNPVINTFFDSLGMGLGFTFALVIISGVREVLGNGTFLGIQVMPATFQPVLLMVLPPGAFLTLGLVIGFFNMITELLAKRREAKERGTIDADKSAANIG
ncbi:electron transport complex subunit RsxE [Calorimonas adulescens]|jgi:electron transport complex, RnfABCDGE type, E subunit|uniref:Ion-translocating oxidoreductase complex subunit E n=1 Tax=Calorimonas adulescens TaxID=2606906 RepID=A0A5D8QCJ4_9THEO|nr:electron transport complex subunit E [Calorimonas adulescens]TZE82252.1 electron transport complex subunit E [Calorimonas adulescens]